LEKVEAQQQSGDSQNPITADIHPYVPMDQVSKGPIDEALRNLNEEALQLSELLDHEEKLIKELCTLLRQVLGQLKISFTIQANVVPQPWGASRMYLNAEAHVISINDKNEVTSRALEHYPPHVIFNIVTFVLPELSKSLTSYRQKISSRIDLFDRINQELKNLSKIFGNSPRKSEEDGNIQDGVKKALVDQQTNQSQG
jgi:hypothetical protein